MADIISLDKVRAHKRLRERLNSGPPITFPAPQMWFCFTPQSTFQWSENGDVTKWDN